MKKLNPKKTNEAFTLASVDKNGLLSFIVESYSETLQVKVDGMSKSADLIKYLSQQKYKVEYGKENTSLQLTTTIVPTDRFKELFTLILNSDSEEILLEGTIRSESNSKQCNIANLSIEILIDEYVLILSCEGTRFEPIRDCFSRMALHQDIRPRY